jgi:hypothetical protein
MTGAPLDVLGSHLAQGAPRYPGGTSACCRWGAFFGAYGRDRLITMPWGVDVAQWGTHYAGESCRRSGIFQSRRLCRCALRTSHLMPSWELFEQQDEAYRARALPPHVTARVAVEQAAPLGWDRYAGLPEPSSPCTTSVLRPRSRICSPNSASRQKR